MNLIELLDPSFRRLPRKVAIKLGQHQLANSSWSKQTYLFRDLDQLSNRLASFLASRGLVKGDRVCVYAPNSPWIPVLFLATLKLGLIYVPMNILYRRQEIAQVVTDAEPKVLVIDSSVLEIARGALPVRDVRPLLLSHPHDLENIASSTDSCRPRCPVEGEDIAGIFYTSGTTGGAKGAVLSHNNLAFNAIALHAAWRWSKDDKLLLCLPLAHLHGLANGLLGALLAGAKTILLDRFTAGDVLERLAADKVTVFYGVPTMYARLTSPETNLGKRNLSSMRLFVSGSAPLPPDIYEHFHLLTGYEILERYGLSEALMVASNPYAGECRAGSVGTSLPGVAVQIRATDGREAGPSEEGELWVKGPNVFQGYWRNPKATEQALSCGWLRSGDLAKRSTDGYITICGRFKELIISGGYNIYPREVEEIICTAPGVREAAVVGLAHPIKGEVVRACVVAKPSHKLDWEALEAHCRKHLASFKVPKVWEEVDEVPRNAMGKILRHRLQN